MRSMHVLYESGLLGKRKYTSIRNSSDISCEPAGKKRKNSKTEIMPGLTIPKLLPHKTLMASLHAIDIGEVLDLSSLAAQQSLEPVHGVYRPLEPLLLRLADLYLQLHSSDPLEFLGANCVEDHPLMKAHRTSHKRNGEVREENLHNPSGSLCQFQMQINSR